MSSAVGEGDALRFVWRLAVLHGAGDAALMLQTFQIL